MIIKLVKGKGKRQKEKIYTNVDNILRQDFEDHIEVRLHYHPERSTPVVINLPEDGDVIYRENDSGKTIGSIRFDELGEKRTYVEPEKQFRVLGKGLNK